MKKFDVIVIGTGSGSIVAKRCASAGKKTAIIDSNPFGGTCALRGCDPKKVLVGVANILSLNQQLLGRGISTTAIASWKELMQFKESFTEPLPAKSDEELINAGIATFHGRAQCMSENTLRVNDEVLKAEKFVIANGAKARKLAIPGEDLLIDSTQFLELQELPNDIVFVGGGYIAFEFANIAARFGVKVTIVHRGECPLENFDADLVKLLVKAGREQGIQIILNTEVTSITKDNGGFSIRATRQGKELEFLTSLAVHSAGRTADIEDMNLIKMGVATNKKGVEVNDFMQSISNKNVYACGDANDKGFPLTPVAAKEAIIAAGNLLKGNHTTINYGHVPSNVFSIPPLAMVGITEKKAKEDQLNYVIRCKDTSEWYSSRRLHETVSAFKVLIDKDTNQILGAHLLGNHVEEIINIFALAMNSGVKANDLKKTIFSYPTKASDIVHML